MKSSTVFKKAAKKIFTGETPFSCIAVCYVRYGRYESTSPEVIAYKDYFMPTNTPDNSHQGWFGHSSLEENQLARQLALLFMAEMSKDLEK